MAEFEEKLNSILGNQEAMGQIMALARSLSGGGERDGETSEAQPAQEGTAPDAEGQSTQSIQPEAASAPDLSALLGQIDPGMLQMGMRLFREYQGDDDRNTALLAALRPFLREDRRARLDRAMELTRLTRLIRVALGTMGERGRKAVYNRYIPDGTSYTRVEMEDDPPTRPRREPAQERPQPPPERSGGQGERRREQGRSRPQPGRQTAGGAFPLSGVLTGKDGLSALFRGGERGGLSGILKSLHLEQLDPGDVLLMLIVLYLLVEGDDLELVIALGLVLLMGLGESGERDKTTGGG